MALCKRGSVWHYDFRFEGVSYQGFQGDVQDKILGATSHVMVSDLSGRGLEGYQDMTARIRALPGVESASPVAYSTVLITGVGESSGALVKGIDFDQERPAAPWLEKLEAGEIPKPGGARDGLLLGRELAEQPHADRPEPGDEQPVLEPTDT